MKKAKKILIPAVIVLIIIGLSLYSYFSKRVPVNPDDAVGNTAGNLLNGGNFCELNGRIYFSNPYDNGYLYAMNSDCTKIECLVKDTASSINAYGKYLFYIRNNGAAENPAYSLFRGQLYGVVRCKLNGSDVKTLFTGYSADLALSANTLVFNANDNSVLSTYTTDLSGKNTAVINNINVNNASVVDGKIYYSNNIENHAVYTMSVDDGSKSLYLDENTYSACRIGNDLYYIDLNNDYALTRINLTTLSRTVLTTDHVVLYNVYDKVIYYQKENGTHALMRMNLDGSNRMEIAEGDITSVSCTSLYTFFQMYNSDTLYRVETYNGLSVDRFYIQLQ